MIRAWRSLRHLWVKFVVILLPFVLALALTLAGVFYQARQEELSRKLVGDLEVLAHNHTPAMAEIVWMVDLENIHRLLKVLLSSRHLVCVEAIDAVSGRHVSEPTPDCMLEHPPNRRIEHPLHVQGKPIGTLTLAYTTRHIEEELRDTLLAELTMIVVVIAGMIAAVLIAFQLTITRPLASLVESMGRVTAGSSRRPVDWRSNDELGRMITVYNQMVEQLISRTEALQAAKEQTERAFDDLKVAQGSLVQAEKMASLGRLVAGVAHEINTPVGITITAASLLDERTKQISTLFGAGQVRRADLATYLETARETSALVFANGQRAAELIQSFKQVAVDQTSEKRRLFDLRRYAEDVVHSLTPTLRKAGHQVTVSGPEGLMIDGYPGALSQVLTNFVMNSTLHAYPAGRAGKLNIAVAPLGPDMVELRYSDDGCGIPPEDLAKIFDPFFTTKRNEGGSGLGLHIVFNIVVQMLRGTIQVDSQPTRGTTFFVRFPTSPPDVEAG